MSDEWATRPERSTLWVMQLYAWVSLRAGRAAGRLFLPRPIHWVSSLPRNAMGKLPLHTLQQLLDQVSS